MIRLAILVDQHRIDEVRASIVAGLRAGATVLVIDRSCRFDIEQIAREIHVDYRECTDFGEALNSALIEHDAGVLATVDAAVRVIPELVDVVTPLLSHFAAATGGVLGAPVSAVEQVRALHPIVFRCDALVACGGFTVASGCEQLGALYRLADTGMIGFCEVPLGAVTNDIDYDDQLRRSQLSDCGAWLEATSGHSVASVKTSRARTAAARSMLGSWLPPQILVVAAIVTIAAACVPTWWPLGVMAVCCGGGAVAMPTWSRRCGGAAAALIFVASGTQRYFIESVAAFEKFVNAFVVGAASVALGLTALRAARSSGFGWPPLLVLLAAVLVLWAVGDAWTNSSVPRRRRSSRYRVAEAAIDGLTVVDISRDGVAFRSDDPVELGQVMDWWVWTDAAGPYPISSTVVRNDSEIRFAQTELGPVLADGIEYLAGVIGPLEDTDGSVLLACRARGSVKLQQ